MARKTLVLVDGSSYLYRAFHALPMLTNSKHHPTGAMHGVIAMLRRLVQSYQPDYFAVVFDPRGPTLRDEWYADYKANRPPMPDELAVQIEPLHDIIRALGYPLLQVAGVEADDVIGTLATQAEAAGMDVVISTGDKDLAQLVDDHVSLINTMDDSVLDRAGVEAKFGVPPERIVDYLTLVGDSVDNVPGVPKVGPKTAVKWLGEYGSLDDIIAHAEDIKGKIGDNLRGALEQLPLSRKLVTILRDVEVEAELEQLVREPIDAARLVELYRTFEFNTWLKELEAEGVAETRVAPPDAPAAEYEAVLDEASLARWLETLEAAACFAFDTETTSLDYMQAQIVGVSFAAAAGHAAYVPLAHAYPGCPDQLPREDVLERLRPLLEDPARAKLGHNLKYDRNVLANHGIVLRGIAHDTMLESYVLNSTASRHDFDSVAQKYLNHRTIHYEEVAGKGAKQIGFAEVAIEDATPYAAEDAEVCLRLHEALHPRIAEDPGLAAVYRDIEIPLVPVLADMERRGVYIDTRMLLEQSAELEQRMAEIEARAHDAAGEVFNIGSPKQIQAILFDKLGLPVLQKTPKGQPSTAESVLAELAHDYDLPRLILDHRGLAKLKSTYTDKLPNQVDPDTGRVHTSYHQAVAATGRLSSSDPNLQNIPVRTAEGRRIRQAFVAPPGKLLLAADYSQIELRIMAHLSGDSGLLGAFEQGLDVHRATAAEVFGSGLEAVGDDQRRAAKAINFGLIYGMSAFGLARQLGIERSAAQDYIERYFARYPGVRAYMDGTRERAREQGYVETVFGRRLYLPDINARNPQMRQYAERTAINAPMQGTAADIIKRAMIAVDRWLAGCGHEAALIMQVHDELVLEVAREAADDVAEAVRGIMEGAADLAVPLIVEVGRGDNWDEAH
ncbi:MAG: DNA polymerase I [Gammaproteobacteria bacterium]|nr:DNA polymerase I [Gammaproteobacteria bacterium]MCP5200664.1 DNA polymerase I [Gammaproteobacteria bacterium]